MFPPRETNGSSPRTGARAAALAVASPTRSDFHLRPQMHAEGADIPLPLRARDVTHSHSASERADSSASRVKAHRRIVLRECTGRITAFCGRARRADRPPHHTRASSRCASHQHADGPTVFRRSRRGSARETASPALPCEDLGIRARDERTAPREDPFPSARAEREVQRESLVPPRHSHHAPNGSVQPPSARYSAGALRQSRRAGRHDRRCAPRPSRNCGVLLRRPARRSRPATGAGTNTRGIEGARSQSRVRA